MCCVVCGCLGFCPDPELRWVDGSGFRFLQNRSQAEFEESAKQSCKFCDLAFQASRLLTSIGSNPSLMVGVYSEYPAEIHAIPPSDDYNVVEIYAVSESPVSPYPQLGRDVPVQSDSRESIRFLKDCYQTCLKSHRACDQELASLPKRVIDISSSELKLLETQVETKANYAALSYTWGTVKCRIATTETLQQLKEQIPWNSLPVVFRDAIDIAQKLGIKYIWIDTVCILQDDAHDWEVEASKMAEIFSNANITIAASSSRDPTDAFLTGHVADFHGIPLQFPAGNTSTVFKARRKVPLGLHAKSDSHKTSDPIDTRAWTLQEQKLSNRLVSFTRAELQWKCKECHSCECHIISRRPSKLFPAATDTDGHRINANTYYDWQQIAEKYSARRLTVLDDKLPAMMGLAMRFHQLSGSTYVAGLWQENLLEDLAWRRSPRGNFLPVMQFLAPTFSWMSIVSAVDHQPVRHLYAGRRKYLAEVVDCHCTLKGISPYGRIQDGVLAIQGPTIRATLRCSTPSDCQAYELVIGNRIYTPRTGKEVTCEFSIDCPLDLFDGPLSETHVQKRSLERALTEKTEPFEHMPIKLLSLFSIHSATRFYENFIILGRCRKGSGFYVRLGFGTGKMYTEKTGEPIPKEMRPFQWVPMDNAEKGEFNLDLQLQDSISIV